MYMQSAFEVPVADHEIEMVARPPKPQLAPTALASVFRFSAISSCNGEEDAVDGLLAIDGLLADAVDGLLAARLATETLLMAFFCASFSAHFLFVISVAPLVLSLLEASMLSLIIAFCCSHCGTIAGADNCF